MDILQAAANGDLKEVKRLIEIEKIDPHIKDKDGWTPLYRAAEVGHLEVVQYLIEIAGVNPNAENNNDSVSLSAALNGYFKDVKYLNLLVTVIDPDARSNNKRIALCVAASAGHLEVVRYLLENGKWDPDIKYQNGLISLHLAVQNGHLDVMQYLIEIEKINPDIQSTRGQRLLQHAIKKERPDIIRYFINFAKTDPQAQEKYNLEKISKESPTYPYLQALALMIAIEHNVLDNVKKFYSNEIEILCLRELQYSLLVNLLSSNRFETISLWAPIASWLIEQREAQVQNLLLSDEKNQIKEFVDTHIKEVELLSNFHLYAYAFLEINQLLKLEPDQPLLLLHKGKICTAQNDYPRAKEALLKIVENENNYAAEAYLQLGKIYTVEKDYLEAKKNFSKIIDLNGNLVPEAYFELGNLERQKNNWSEAIENYEKALEAADKDEKVKISDELKLYQQKASCLVARGIEFRNTRNIQEAEKYFDRAIDDYKKVLELDTNNEIAINNLRELPQYFAVNKQKIDSAVLGLESLKQPTHYEFAYFSYAVYNDNDGKLPEGWDVVGTAEQYDLAQKGYFGVAYFHAQRNILIIAHRGTDVGEKDELVDDLWADFDIALSELPQQWDSAEKFYRLITECYLNAKKFVTGHSLGGCLGALTAWQFKVSGVLFDPPGSLEIIQTFLAKDVIDPLSIPVVSYLSHPDLVNTANHHVGDVKHVPILLSPNNLDTLERRIRKFEDENLSFPLLAIINFYGKPFIKGKIKSQGIEPEKFYSVAEEIYKAAVIHLSRHSMEEMLNAFNNDIGMPHKVFKVKKWPSNANQIFQYEMLHRSCPKDFPTGLTETQKFKLNHTIGYEIEAITPNALHIKQFEPHVVDFLRNYKEKGVAEGIDKNLLKHINLEAVELVGNDQIIVKDQQNIFVLRQYLTDVLSSKNIPSETCQNEVCQDSVMGSDSEQCQFEVIEKKESQSAEIENSVSVKDKLPQISSENSKKINDPEPPKKSSASRLSPWLSPTTLLGASHAGYQLISNYLSSFTALPQKIEERETSVSAVVIAEHSNPDNTNSHDDSTKTANPITRKPVASQPTLHDQLYLLRYMIGCLQNSRFWPVIGQYLDWMQQLLPWNQPYPLTKENRETLQACQKTVRELIIKIERQRNTRIGESSFFEEKLLPMQNNLIKLAQITDNLLVNNTASSAEIYEVVSSTNEIKSDLDKLNLKQLNKTLRYAEIKQARLESGAQKTGYEVETDLIIKRQNHKKEKWSITKTSRLDEMERPKIYAANDNTIFWSDSLHKDSQNPEPAIPLRLENGICKK